MADGKSREIRKVAEWRDDVQADDKIRLLGFESRIVGYIEVRRDQVVIDESLGANTRSDCLYDPETVGKYALAQKKGARFPTPVIMEGAKGKEDEYSSIGGFHRIKMAEMNGLTHIRCLLLRHLNQQDAEFLRMALNQIHGKEEPPELQATLAATFMIRHKRTDVAKVAEHFNVKQSTLSSHLRAETLKQKAQARNIVTDKIGKQSLVAVAQIKSEETQLKVVEALAKNPQVPTASVRVLVDDLKYKSQSQAKETIESWQKTFQADKKPGGKPRSRKQTIDLLLLGYLATLETCVTRLPSLEILNQDQLKTLLTRWRETSRRMNQLIAETSNLFPGEE